MPLWAPVRNFWVSVRNLSPRDYGTLTKNFLLATGAVVFLKEHVAEVVLITGESMAPSLSPEYHETRREDAVLLNMWSPTRELRRGDVVQFRNPHKAEDIAIKRVIAMEGDTVLLDKIRRPASKEGPNGTVDPPAAVAWDAWKGEAKIPQGHIWVEGDNRRRSKDSNDYGPISKSLIDGRAIMAVWPPSRFATRPWEGYESRTKIMEGEAQEWTDGLPIELGEIAEPHMPP